MAELGNKRDDTGENKEPTVIQTFNIVLQKVIQVDKPAGYYNNREKTKIFIY